MSCMVIGGKGDLHSLTCTNQVLAQILDRLSVEIGWDLVTVDRMKDNPSQMAYQGMSAFQESEQPS